MGILYLSTLRDISANWAICSQPSFVISKSLKTLMLLSSILFLFFSTSQEYEKHDFWHSFAVYTQSSNKVGWLLFTWTIKSLFVFFISSIVFFEYASHLLCKLHLLYQVPSAFPEILVFHLFCHLLSYALKLFEFAVQKYLKNV